MNIGKTWTKACAVLIALSCFLPLAARAQQPPRYKFDPSWPKDLPNNWILGHVEGVFVDKDDHIWILNNVPSTPADDAGASQNPPLSECCTYAPAVLQLDTDGNVLKAWGGLGQSPEWLMGGKAFYVDKGEHVWIGGGGGMGFAYIGYYTPSPDISKKQRSLASQVVKFTSDGKELIQIGHPRPADLPANNQDTSTLGGPYSMTMDEDAHEVYIGDGALNRRVVVYDSDTGAFKRGWGAYGIPLSEVDNFREPLYDPSKPETHPQKHPYDPSAPPSKQFRGPVMGLKLSVDGLLYVCDRGNDRIQVFTKQGKFVKEFFVAPKTLSIGSAQDIAFSHDPEQKYLLVADTEADVIRILNRSDGTEVGTIGHKGHYGGQWDMLDQIAVDSHGNLYTTEVKYNDRIQRFILEK
jgi:hypothetical protein